MATLLRDIIDLCKVKLVIDLEDSDVDPSEIINSFVLTTEVDAGISSILRAINSLNGCGVFVKGNYGSGKSHLLSFLYLLLKNRDHPILEPYGEIKTREIRPIKVSLVRHPSSMSLERIVMHACGYEREITDRLSVFNGLVKTPTVIIIDELSEFLRSKPSPPMFYEDLRFLQFLGEYALKNPLWIIASLQEWIEETGHISSSIFNRIKDRYPLRINLTSSHIEDIIDKRLIIKKPGALEVISGVFQELRRFYPHLSINIDNFKKTYPLHPFTSRFMVGLTRVFSQHRGVIQFVQAEVSKRLEEPADCLITAEAIFDHFEDRIREIPEYSPLVRVAYDYYKTHIDKVFQKELQRETALSAIKIMVLSELSPLERRKTAREIAEMLLKKISLLTESINYEYIKTGVLEPLVSHQMYIQKEEDRYYIDVSVEEGLKIKAKMKALREQFTDRGYLFSEVCKAFSMPYLPLGELKEGKLYRFTWQNSPRECMASIQSNPLSKVEMDRLLESIKKRVDGCLVVFSPFLERPFNWDKTMPNLFTDLSETQGSPTVYLKAILFWIPRPMSPDEVLAVEDFIAKQLLKEGHPDLKKDLIREEPLFRELITSVYLGGQICDSLGRTLAMKDIGLIPIQRLLCHIFEQPLSELHPKHQMVMPRIEFYTSQQVNTAFVHLIRQGRLTIEEAEQRGLVSFIKGLLEPLGIVAKRGNFYGLSIGPENELISSVLNLVRLESNLYNIRMALKKGQWGLSDHQIDLILSTLLLSGYLVAYQRQEAVELKDIGQLSSGEITSLKEGKALDADLISALPAGRFIWGEIEGAPTPAIVKSMWKEATGFIRQQRKTLEDLHSLLNKYREYSAFKALSIDMPTINGLSMFIDSLSLNLSAQEGIERFLRYLKDNQDMQLQVAYVQTLHRFYTEDFQFVNKCWLYINHPKLKLEPGLHQLKEQIIHCLNRLRDGMANYKQDPSLIEQHLSRLKVSWNDFFERYTTAYREAHHRFYSDPVFEQRRVFEASQEARVLKRLAYRLSTIKFQGEWWDLKRLVDQLPVVCGADLHQELFLTPLCRCGFYIGQTPPSLEFDIIDLAREGIKGFLSILQRPEYRENLEGSITGLALSDRPDLTEKILSLLSISPEKANTTLVLSLLDDSVLEAIDNVLKGKWRIRQLDLTALVDNIRGRRFRHHELRGLLLQWLGDDEEAIIHVRDKDRTGAELIEEGLARYGYEGKTLALEFLKEDLNIGLQGPTPQMLDKIRLNSFSITELTELLTSEQIPYMKKRLRDELFERLRDSAQPSSITALMSISDEPMSEVAKALKLIIDSPKHTGIGLFRQCIAPLSVTLERLNYININEEAIDSNHLQYLFQWLQSAIKGFEASLPPMPDISQLRLRLSQDVLIILDALRYDLWLVLKEVITEEGWKISEEVFTLEGPTNTENFRKAFGISEEEGLIDGRRYGLLRFAERDIGKRGLKRFLRQKGTLKCLHFNFIDSRIHSSTLDLYPLYSIIRDEFATGILPVLKEIGSFHIVSDHGFSDTKSVKERYRHGVGGLWERLLPFVEVRL